MAPNILFARTRFGQFATTRALADAATNEHPSQELADQERAERPLEALLFEMALGVVEGAAGP